MKRLFRWWYRFRRLEEFEDTLLFQVTIKDLTYKKWDNTGWLKYHPIMLKESHKLDDEGDYQIGWITTVLTKLETSMLEGALSKVSKTASVAHEKTIKK